MHPPLSVAASQVISPVLILEGVTRSSLLLFKVRFCWRVATLFVSRLIFEYTLIQPHRLGSQLEKASSGTEQRLKP